MYIPSFSFPRFFAYVWTIVLALSLVFYGAFVYQSAGKFTEFAIGCDPFGYLIMAKDFREARAQSVFHLPDFALKDQQTQKLIHFYDSLQVPSDQWKEAVAPHAHHYFAGSRQVGPQYPPGTGFILSLFPSGKAVQSLNKVLCTFFVLLGVITLLYAAYRNAWRSIGLIALFIYTILEVIYRISNASFSINALLLPLIAAILLLLFPGRTRLMPLLTGFLAGCLLGVAIDARIPIILLLPGVFVLSLDTFSLRSIQLKHLHRAIAFIVGLLLLGFLPLAIYQQAMTGSWYLSTYTGADNSLPTLQFLQTNIDFYFRGGQGSRWNINLFLMLCGAAAMLGYVFSKNGSLHWKKILVACLFLWATSVLYFLTHQAKTLYYMLPSILATACVLSFGSLKIENAWVLSRSPFLNQAKNGWQWLLLLTMVIILLLPSVFTIHRIYFLTSSIKNIHFLLPGVLIIACIVAFALLQPGKGKPERRYSLRSPYLLILLIAFMLPSYISLAHFCRAWRDWTLENPDTIPIIQLPAELVKPNAWLWADLYTGTVRYYTGKPAFKIVTNSSKLREQLYHFLAREGDTQYILNDSDGSENMLHEAEKLGAHLTARGKIGEYTYYRVDWQ